MICSSLNLLVHISIILQYDGLIENMAGTIYREQVKRARKPMGHVKTGKKQRERGGKVTKSCGISWESDYLKLIAR